MFDENNPENIYQRMKVLRSHLDISQKELAKELGITFGAISGIERGNNGPSFPIIEAIAERYPQINMNWFIAGRGKMLIDETNQLLSQIATDEKTDEEHQLEYKPESPQTISVMEAFERIEKWKVKYFDLLEKYRDCLEMALKNKS